MSMLDLARLRDGTVGLRDWAVDLKRLRSLRPGESFGEGGLYGILIEQEIDR